MSTKNPLILALFLLACRKEALPDHDWCADYLGCAEAVEDYRLDDYEASYGAAGSCWQVNSEVTCQNECQSRYATLWYKDDPACPGKVPSDDCAVLLAGQQVCPAFPDYLVPDVCGDLPAREACIAEAMLICDDQLQNRIFNCSFEQ